MVTIVKLCPDSFPPTLPTRYSRLAAQAAFNALKNESDRHRQTKLTTIKAIGNMLDFLSAKPASSRAKVCAASCIPRPTTQKVL